MTDTIQSGGSGLVHCLFIRKHARVARGRGGAIRRILYRVVALDCGFCRHCFRKATKKIVNTFSKKT